MTVRRQRRDWRHYRPVFWAAVLSLGMIAIAALAVLYWGSPS